jgi:hypothetical protein
MTTTTIMQADTGQALERRPVFRIDPTGTVVSDPQASETREQRARRLRALGSDPGMPPVDLRLAAKLLGISHGRAKVLHSRRLRAERVLADPGAGAAQRAKAAEALAAWPKALPYRIHGSPIFDPWQVFDSGRRNERLDEWYEPQRKPPPGRPQGGAGPGIAAPLRDPFPAAARITQLREVCAQMGIDADEATRARLGEQVAAAYAAARGDGMKAVPARTSAVAVVAGDSGAPAELVELLLREAIAAGRT